MQVVAAFIIIAVVTYIVYLCTWGIWKKSMEAGLSDACSNGNLSAVKKYIRLGANIHVYIDAALRYAAYDGHLEVVKYLVEHGADIHALHDDALRGAAENRHLQVVNVLRKAAGAKYKCHNCIIKSTCLELCKDFRKY